MSAITNPNASQLDSTQILQRSFDESQDRIRVDASVTVDAITGEVNVDIDAATGDNIAIANEDGSKKVTVTTVGSHEALDVNVVNSSESQLLVSTPTISNVSIPTAAIEQSFNIPIGTKRFSMRIRGSAQLNISYTSGASGTNYTLIPIGCEYTENYLLLTSILPIYFQANKNTQVLEIITWS